MSESESTLISWFTFQARGNSVLELPHGWQEPNSLGANEQKAGIRSRAETHTQGLCHNMWAFQGAPLTTAPNATTHPCQLHSDFQKPNV